MASKGLTGRRYCLRTGFAVSAVLAWTAVVGFPSGSSAAVVVYNSATGLLSLDDSGANYDPLDNFQVYLGNVSYTPSSTMQIGA